MQEQFSMISHDKYVHVVDPDIERRATISYELFASSFHAEIYEDVQELVGHCPQGGAVLIADEHSTGSDVSLEIIRSQCGYFPVAFYSADPSPQQIVRALQGGALDYIQWPFSGDVLRATVAALGLHGDQLRKIENQKTKARELVETLTGREADVLEGILAGQSNKENARRLGISPRTVEIHRGNMMIRLNAESVAYAVRIGLYAGLGG